jgi:hypothetical protein
VPFKSQAQRRKFAQLLVEGKISNETFEEWNRETGRTKLPERAARKRVTIKKRTAPRRSRPKSAVKTKRKAADRTNAASKRTRAAARSRRSATRSRR